MAVALQQTLQKMPREMLAQAAPRFCPRYVAADCQIFSCGICVELCKRRAVPWHSEASFGGEEAWPWPGESQCNERSGFHPRPWLSVSGSGLARRAVCEAHETLRLFLPRWPGRQPVMAPVFPMCDAPPTRQAQEPSQQPKDPSHAS